MKRRFPSRMIAIAAVMLLAGGLVAACDDLLVRRYPEMRYRLTVEVETPEGLRTGSSVIATKWALASKRWGPLGGTSGDAWGEAVAVDLGRRGTLFVLLNGADGEDWAIYGPGPGVSPLTFTQRKALRDRHPDAEFDPVTDFHMRYAAGLKGPKVVPRWLDPYSNTPNKPRSGYPLMVRFRDPALPKTVEAVDPDRLDAVFGKGVKLRRLVKETTDDAVTRGIEQRLPWVRMPAERSLKPGHGPRDHSLAAMTKIAAFYRDK